MQNIQTLREFIQKPFNTKDKLKHLKYEDRYLKFKKANKIYIKSAMLIDNNYYIHIKVPSESQKGAMEYDVVIEFFTDTPSILKSPTLAMYNINFFSNSPGFVYKYAAKYKEQGMLISALYGKFEKTNLDTLPKKDEELFYDSSIYYASKFLLDSMHSNMIKSNVMIKKARNIQDFLDDIQDIESVNISREINTLEASIKKEIAGDKQARAKVRDHQEKLNNDRQEGKHLQNKKIEAKAKIKPIKNIIKKIQAKKPKKKK